MDDNEIPTMGMNFPGAAADLPKPRKRKRRKKKNTETIRVTAAPSTLISSGQVPDDVNDPEVVAERIAEVEGAEDLWSEERAERLHNIVHRFFSTCHAERQEMVNHWHFQWMLYNNKSPSTRFVRSHGAQVWMPIANTMVETIAPRTIKGLIGPDKWYSLFPWNEESKIGAEKMEHMVGHLAHKGKWKTPINDGVKLGSIHGFFTCDLVWKRRKVKVLVHEGTPEEIAADSGLVIGKKQKLIKITRQEKVFEGLELEYIGPMDHYQRLSDTTIQEALDGDGVGRRMSMPYWRVQHLHADGFFNDEILSCMRRLVDDEPSRGNEGSAAKGEPYVHDGGNAGDPMLGWGWGQRWFEHPLDQLRKIIRGESPQRFIPLGDDDDTPKEMWFWRWIGMAAVDKAGKDWRMLEVWFCGDKMVRCKENMHPLGSIATKMLRINSRPESYVGFGVIEPYVSIIEAINEFWNLTLDVAALGTRPMLLQEHNAGIPGNRIEFGPGHVLNIRRKTGIEWMKPPPGINEGQGMILALWNSIREGSGLTPIVQGLSPGNRATSNEISTLEQEGNMRFINSIELGETEFCEPLIEDSVAQIQVHMTTIEWVKVLGPDGFEMQRIAPADLVGQYSVYCKGAKSTANQSLHVQQMQNLLTVIRQIVAVDPTILQRVKLAEMVQVIAEIQGFPYRERWLKPVNKKKTQGYFRRMQTFAVGGEIKANEEEDNIGFMEWLSLPNPITGSTFYDDFMADEEIEYANKLKFQVYFNECMLLATEAMEAEMAAQRMAMMAGGAAPMAPGGEAGVSPPEARSPRPQEQARSQGGIARQIGSAPAGAAASQAPRQGLK